MTKILPPSIRGWLFYARFSNCHTENMANREELLTLRNDLIQRELGNILLAYLQDYVTEQAVKNLDATEIKGMCRLIQQIKDIPKVVEQK